MDINSELIKSNTSILISERSSSTPYIDIFKYKIKNDQIIDNHNNNQKNFIIDCNGSPKSYSYRNETENAFISDFNYPKNKINFSNKIQKKEKECKFGEQNFSSILNNLKISNNDSHTFKDKNIFNSYNNINNRKNLSYNKFEIDKNKNSNDKYIINDQDFALLYELLEFLISDRIVDKRDLIESMGKIEETNIIIPNSLNLKNSSFNNYYKNEKEIELEEMKNFSLINSNFNINLNNNINSDCNIYGKNKFFQSRKFLIFNYDENYLLQKSSSFNNSNTFILDNTNNFTNTVIGNLNNQNISNNLNPTFYPNQNYNGSSGYANNSNVYINNNNTSLTNNTIISNNFPSINKNIQRMATGDSISEFQLINHIGSLNNDKIYGDFRFKDLSEIEYPNSINFKNTLQFDKISELNHNIKLSANTQISEGDSLNTIIIEDIKFDDIRINLHQALKLYRGFQSSDLDDSRNLENSINDEFSNNIDQSILEENFANKIYINKKEKLKKSLLNFSNRPMNNNTIFSFNNNFADYNVNNDPSNNFNFSANNLNSLNIKNEEENKGSIYHDEIIGQNEINDKIYNNFIRNFKKNRMLRNTICVNRSKKNNFLYPEFLKNNNFNEIDLKNIKNLAKTQKNLNKIKNPYINYDLNFGEHKTSLILMPNNFENMLNKNQNKDLNKNIDALNDNNKTYNKKDYNSIPKNFINKNLVNNLNEDLSSYGSIINNKIVKFKKINEETEEFEYLLTNDKINNNLSGNINLNNINNVNNINNYFNIHNDSDKSYKNIVETLKKDLLNNWKSQLKIQKLENFSLFETKIKFEIKSKKNSEKLDVINTDILNYDKDYNNVDERDNKLFLKKKSSKINNTLTPSSDKKNKEIFLLDKDLKELDSNNNKIHYKNSKSIIFIVIDDNIYIRESISRLLQICLKSMKKKSILKKDFEILEGADGIDALKYIIDPNIGCRVKGIFIDENMEYLNGSETIKIIRNLQNLTKVRNFNIATVTAFEDSVTRNRILQAGVDEIYPKPLSKIHVEDFFTKFPIQE